MEEIYKQLSILEIGEFSEFTKDQYKDINTAICQHLKYEDKYFKMKSLENSVFVFRINKSDKVSIKKEILNMEKDEQIIEDASRYHSFHVTVSRLNKSFSNKKWKISKDKDWVTTKRIM